MRRLLSFAFLLPVAALAAADPVEKVLSIAPFVSRDVVPAGQGAEIALVVKLEGHWHVNAHRPADELLIPTVLSFEPALAVKLSDPAYPDPRPRKFEFADAPLLVYEGKFTIRLKAEVDAGATPGPLDLKGVLRYQACDNQRCLAPRNEPVKVTLEVGASDAESKPLHPEVFGASPQAPAGKGEAGKPGGALAAATAPGDTPDIARRALALFSEGNYALAFGLIFLGGLLLSLTPCVYPVIPITLAFFTNQSQKRGGKTFALALVYVLGMALMYSSLGVLAALGGKSLGAALASPAMLVFIALVMVALAASMFGWWEIGVPSFLATRLASSPSGYGGALFMGLTVGILAAPCIGPFVLALFTFVAAIGKVGVGFAIFFTLALGLGFPFLILGSASGAISRLPRSGEWMVWMRQFFGFVLLGVAVYFLRPLIGNPLASALGVLIAIAAGIFLWCVSKEGRTVPSFRRVRATVGFLCLAGGALGQASRMGLVGAEGGAHIAFRDYEESAFTAALTSGKPVLLDFTAEWCLPCKELEKYTFADDAVASAAQRFHAFRADGTFDGKPAIEALKERYAVNGFPTVVFIDSKGAERSELRVVGFVEAEDFRQRLERVD